MNADSPLVELRRELYRQLAAGTRFVRIGDVLKALERHDLDQLPRSPDQNQVIQ